MNIIEIQQAVKSYGQVRSVDHLELSVREGEIFGLLGPNGAGKSTTIHMICGLLKPDRGDILVGGVSVVKHPHKVKQQLGIVPQELAIYPDLSAADNVRYFARLYGLRGAVLKQRVEEALALVGLSDRSKDKPKTFSGGMKRRLNIACALAHRPDIIIMDEPTVGIDPQSRNYILESVRTLNQAGMTVIYTSHYMEEVASLCSRLAILDHGRMIACGTQEELKRDIAQEEKIIIQVDHPDSGAGVTLAEALEEAGKEFSNYPGVRLAERTEDGFTLHVSTSPLQRPKTYLQDMLFILSQHQLPLLALNREEADLETLFLSLTGRKLRN